MDTPEMTEVPVKVELLGDDSVTGRLLQVETGWRDEVSGGKEVGEFLADIKVRFGEDRGEVAACRQLSYGGNLLDAKSTGLFCRMSSLT